MPINPAGNNTLPTKASELGWRPNRLETDVQTLEKRQHVALLFGGKSSVEAGEVDRRFRHQGRQVGDEIQWLEDDVRRAVSVRRLQQVTDVAVRRERQALLGNCRPTDVSAEPFELLALIRSRRNASVQGKSSNLADSVIEGLATGWQRLQGEHLATLLRPNGDA